LKVTVDPKAPTLSAEVGAHTTGAAIEVTGTAETAGDTITLYDNGAQIWTGTVATTSFTITTSADYTKGKNALTATETDSLGLTGPASAALSVTAATARHTALFTQLAAGVSADSAAHGVSAHPAHRAASIELHTLLAHQ
jgi:hypothetical protein